MKYFLLVTLLFLNGCATAVSEYNQGCRDGIDTAVKASNIIFVENHIVNIDGRNKICNYLEAKHKEQNKETYGRGK